MVTSYSGNRNAIRTFPAPALLLLAGGMALAATLAVGWFTVREQAPVILLFYTLLGLVGGGVAARAGVRALSIFLLAYFWTVLFAIGLHDLYIGRYGVPYYIGGSDDLAFEQAARFAVALGSWRYNVLESVNLWDYDLEGMGEALGYVYFVGMLMRIGDSVGGYHTFLPRLVNAFLLGLLAVAAYQVAVRWMIRRQIAFGVGLAVGLLPIMTWTAAHVFRDILMALAMMTVALLWAPTDRFRTRDRLVRWGITLVLVLVLREVRFMQALVMVGIALVADLLAPSGLSLTRARLFYLLAGGLVLVVLAAAMAPMLGNIGTRLSGMQARYLVYNLEKADGLSGYVFSAPPPLGYLLRMVYGLIVPLPIPSTEPERLWLSLGTLVHYAFLPFAAGGLVLAIRQRLYWPLVAAFLALFTGAVLITFTTRHIVQYLPFAAILAGHGYQHLRRYRLTIWLLMAGLGALLALVYAYLQLL